jgi:hypothetical protein
MLVITAASRRWDVPGPGASPYSSGPAGSSVAIRVLSLLVYATCDQHGGRRPDSAHPRLCGLLSCELSRLLPRQRQPGEGALPPPLEEVDHGDELCGANGLGFGCEWSRTLSCYDRRTPPRLVTACVGGPPNSASPEIRGDGCGTRPRQAGSVPTALGVPSIRQVVTSRQARTVGREYGTDRAREALGPAGAVGAPVTLDF